jgi:Flp pilus assembly protein TadG
VANPMPPRQRRGSREHGAAAVEMALVMPILFMLLIGIVNYGLWFNDSLSLREGVREAARQAVVQTLATGCTGTTLAAVACGARAQIGAAGRSYAMVSAPNGWVKGQEVVVCGMVKSVNFTGFVPLPAGGLIESKTSMSIESVTPAPTDTTSYADTAPTGGNWTWCTP